MLSLLVSWALTLAGLIIESKNGALWIALILTALGVFGTWFWNFNRSHGNIALVFTELPHAALWIIYKCLPEIGDSITNGIMLVLGVIVVIAFIIIGSDDAPTSASTSSSASGRAETDLSNMPGYIYSGTTCYGRRNSFGWGVEYVNESNSGDVITITNIYSMGGGAMSTNAGHFTY